MLYVVAHDGGYEGHSLPVLAFTELEAAKQWVAGQNEIFSIAEVPLYPELPCRPWYNLEPVE